MPSGIFVTAVAVSVPALVVIVAPLGLLMLIEYVLPAQVPALKLTAGVAHGVVQSAGATIVIDDVQPPVTVAVTVTLTPVGAVTVLPLTLALAGDTVMVAPDVKLIAAE